MTRFVLGNRNRRTRRRTLGVLAMAMLASVLTVAPVTTTVAGAQSGGTEFIRAGQGDVDIIQVVMNHGGQYVVQNAPATSVVDSSATPLFIESITVNDDGVTKVLDDFNFTGISVQNTNWGTDQTGVNTSQNGVQTTPAQPGFWDNVEQVLGSTDLRDYLDTHPPSSNPQLTDFEPDFDFFFERPLDNDDYLLVTERFGNTFFDLIPLDANGDLIPGSKRLGFDTPYGWNTGYAPSDLTSQPQWFTMADVDSFGVDTDVTPIAGFRINNDGGADVKFFAMAAEPFTPGCPPGSPVEDTPAATSGSWTLNNGKWTASLGSGTVSFTTAPGLVVSAGSMDALDVGDFSQPSVAGNASLGVLHWFPDAKDVSFEFDPPVANPEMHLSRLGGYSGWDEVVWSHSTTIELKNGLTWTETAGNGPHFESTDTTVRRTLGTLLTWPATGDNDDFLTGMAGGSLGLTGLIATMNLEFTATGQQFDDATGDGIEFVFTKPAVEGCGGDTELDVSKTANASTVVVGADVEWSLTADSVGTGAADNATIVDDIAAGLIPKQVRTGSWTPVGIEARFEVKVDGSWTTVATVDGNDDATYNLPSGVDELRVTYLDDLAVAFDMTAPIRLTTTVDDPPLDNQGEPEAIINCAVWDADDMSAVQSCASVDVELVNAKPDLTVSTLVGVATPGSQLSHQIRIENLTSAAKPYVEPFVAVLLPDNLDYDGWQPLSTEQQPTITVTQNYNGTGRTLVRWDYVGAAANVTPGEVFDVRLTTRIRAASPPGPSTLQFVTGTNDTTWQIKCVDPEIADVFDHDSDGVLAESLCASSVQFEVDANFEVVATASTQGDPDLPFVVYDDVDGAGGVGIDLGSIATGSRSEQSTLASTSTDGSWTVSTTRAGAKVPATAANCGTPLDIAATSIVDGNCSSTSERWFQRSFDITAADSADVLVLQGVADSDSAATFYVNGTEQRTVVNPGGYIEVFLTGWRTGSNTLEVQVAGSASGTVLGTQLRWMRPSVLQNANDAVSVEQFSTPTQNTTGFWGWSAAAELAADGNTEGNYWLGSVAISATTSNEWTQFDIGVVAPIDEIRIFNRTDCCGSRLSGSALFVSQVPFASNTVSGMRAQAGVTELELPADMSAASHTVNAQGAVGRYIRVALLGDYLQLAEVQIDIGLTPADGWTRLDSDWTVSDTLNGTQRPAVGVARSCVAPSGAAPGQGSYIWADNCTRTDYGRGTSSDPFTDLNGAQDVPSGIYWFDLAETSAFQAEVDDSNGGGWVLVLNYVHDDQTNPPLDVRTDSLPLPGSGVLGNDESGSPAWGHASNALFSALDADEVRFYAATNGGGQVIHFRTTEGIDYFETGAGSVDLDALLADYVALDDHTATLPASATASGSNAGDGALTDNPFGSVTANWNIGANEWDVDDDAVGSSNETIHRAWVRSNDASTGNAAGTYYFHRNFDLSSDDEPASLLGELRFLVDNSVQEIYINGVLQGIGGTGWTSAATLELTGPFTAGQNTLTVVATSDDGPAALAADLNFIREGFACADNGGHTSRPCIAQTTSHGPGSLRFDVENVGNVSTGGVVAYSILPSVGDTYALSGEPRGSEYRPTVTGEAVLLSRPAQAAVTIAYSTANNPCTPELSGGPAGAAIPTGCDNGWSVAPADLSTVTAIRIIAEVPSGQVWAAGETLSVSLPIKAAQGSFERDEFAWMPFAYVLDSAAGTPFAAVETEAAGLRINQSQNGLGDWIWLDTNRDGVQDPGEVGQNGVKIELYDANRDLVASTTSQNLNNDSARPGYYWFGDLEPGQYFIKLVEVPISWNTMTPDIGSDDTDSDLNPLTLEGPLVSIIVGEFDRSVDVGFFVPQGPAVCDDTRPVFDPTDTDVSRRPLNDFTPCPS